MAQDKLTAFQRLQRILSSGSNQKNYISNDYVIQPKSSDVIATAGSKGEYKRKLIQAQQQKLLAKQWVKASNDITAQGLAGLNDIKQMYLECDLMDNFPEIGAALDVTMEECCYVNDEGNMINISSKSDRIKSILQDLFVNRLSIHTSLPMICRAMCKYGNNFMLLNVDAKNGILGWKQLPVYETERWENGQKTPFATPIGNLNTVDENSPQETQFVWIGQNEYIPYRNWQVAHFRLLYDSIFLPYGCSFLNKARRHFRMLSMMEDMMLIYRLDRSVERRVFKINVGAIDEADVQSYVQEIANNFKRKPIIDPTTGQIDLRKSFMNVTEDFFVPTRDENAPSPIETLSGAQNLTAMDDIKFIQNKVFTALRVPKSFLNFEEAAGDGKNLSLMDVRFTRTVNRIQQCLLMELNKIAIIHLSLLGFDDELNNFTLSMNNPSSQAEMLELENLAKKVTTAKDAVTDPGGGVPLTSMMWAWKHIFKWTDKQIEQNLEEIRLESALAAELEKTTQIIKRTGVFDKVDNIYGEPGAQYSEQPVDEEGDFGGNSGGGMPIGGGDMDFGGDDIPDEIGSEGEMDMDMAANEENGDVIPDMDNTNPNSGETPSNLTDSFKRNAKTKGALGNSLNKADLITELINISNNNKKESDSKPEIYNKAFFINEELDKIRRNLDAIK